MQEWMTTVIDVVNLLFLVAALFVAYATIGACLALAVMALIKAVRQK